MRATAKALPCKPEARKPEGELVKFPALKKAAEHPLAGQDRYPVEMHANNKGNAFGASSLKERLEELGVEPKVEPLEMPEKKLKGRMRGFNMEMALAAAYV